MAITIAVADIKRKAMINSTETTYDSAITSLIAEMQGPIEYSIADIYLSNTANINLQATLKLGILEVIAGEFLEQLRREFGSTEEASIAGVTLGKSAVRGVDLVQQGATRLAPFLKSLLPAADDSASMSSTADITPQFSIDQEVW